MKVYINPFKMWHGSFIPEWLLCRKELSQGAKICYARMLRYAGKDGKCNPKISSIAEEIGVSDRQCSTYIKELINHSLIESKRTGLKQANRYFFLGHSWMDSDTTADQDMKDTSDQDMKNTADQDMKDTSDPIIRNEESQFKESQSKGSEIPERTANNGIEPFQDFDIEKHYQRWLSHLKAKGRLPTLFAQEEQRLKLRMMGKDKAIVCIKYSIENDWMSLHLPDQTQDNHEPKMQIR